MLLCCILQRHDWTYPGYRPNLGRGDSLRSLKECGSDDNNVEQRPRQFDSLLSVSHTRSYYDGRD